MTDRNRVAGEGLFDIFPDNPGDPLADGVKNLYASLRIAAETGRPHFMKVQRDDIRDETGAFVIRHWLPCNVPVFDDDGRLRYIMHQVEEVGAQPQGIPASPVEEEAPEPQKVLRQG